MTFTELKYVVMAMRDGSSKFGDEYSRGQTDMANTIVTLLSELEDDGKDYDPAANDYTSLSEKREFIENNFSMAITYENNMNHIVEILFTSKQHPTYKYEGFIEKDRLEGCNFNPIFDKYYDELYKLQCQIDQDTINDLLDDDTELPF